MDCGVRKKFKIKNSDLRKQKKAEIYQRKILK